MHGSFLKRLLRRGPPRYRTVWQYLANQQLGIGRLKTEQLVSYQQFVTGMPNDSQDPTRSGCQDRPEFTTAECIHPKITDITNLDASGSSQ